MRRKAILISFFTVYYLYFTPLMVVLAAKNLLHHTLQCHIQLLSDIEIIFQTIRCIPHLKDRDAYSNAEIIQTSTHSCKPVKWQTPEGKWVFSHHLLFLYFNAAFVLSVCISWSAGIILLDNIRVFAKPKE